MEEEETEKEKMEEKEIIQKHRLAASMPKK